MRSFFGFRFFVVLKQLLTWIKIKSSSVATSCHQQGFQGNFFCVSQSHPLRPRPFFGRTLHVENKRGTNTGEGTNYILPLRTFHTTKLCTRRLCAFRMLQCFCVRVVKARDVKSEVLRTRRCKTFNTELCCFTASCEFRSHFYKTLAGLCEYHCETVIRANGCSKEHSRPESTIWIAQRTCWNLII